MRYKRGRVTNITKIQKNYENIHQQIGQHRRNEQISRDKHLPRMKQEETDILHRPITNTEIKFAVKKKHSQKTKNLDLDIFTGEFYHTYKEELILILLKVFQKN